MEGGYRKVGEMWTRMMGKERRRVQEWGEEEMESYIRKGQGW